MVQSPFAVQRASICCISFFSPQGEEPVLDVNRTRLWLNDATSQVLANGLELLGVSAPERM